MDQENAGVEKYDGRWAVVELVTDMLKKARERRASDVHLDPQEMVSVVRFRIDGQLQLAAHIVKELHGEVVARLKIMAGLRTDERLLPQDGRCTVESFDLRMTTVASYYGESVVLRLLERQVKTRSLTELGFDLEQQRLISEIIKYPQGLILVTGPTGSGKTTTLYTLLGLLNRSTHSIITLEDPIEYAMPGIRQLQVQMRRGLNFSNGLRSMLRQDPDIIMVGEMRDAETATLAIQAAMTGHLVISTLHTNSAVASILRLVDLGVAPYMIAATVRLVINQRLARMVCKKCEGGCAHCLFTGYFGRTVVGEVFEVTALMREAIARAVSQQELEKIAEMQGLRSLKNIGLEKCKEKITTVDEIIRITQN